LAVGEYIHEKITNSELAVLDTFGHCPHLSNPELTYKVINEFIN
jgi:sigma-B regulation protein RsbQ